MPIVQVLAGGKRPFREELHVRDPGFQASKCGTSFFNVLVECFDDQPDSLTLAKAKVLVRFQNALGFVYSEPTAGTTFRLYFPQASESRRPDMMRDELEDSVPGGQETVLVIEDEPALLLLAAGILEEEGYTVLRALNGPEALNVARSHEGTRRVRKALDA